LHRDQFKMSRIVIFLFFFLVHTNAFAVEKVEYITDSIAQKDGEYIKLLSGSSWLLSSPSLALVADNAVILFRTFEAKGKKPYDLPIFYHGGLEIPIKHIDGAIVKESGFLVTVVNKFNDGANLELDDGTILSIPQYDRFDTGWWLPPYPAFITADGMYMWNLKEGKKVWVDGIQ